MPEDDIMPTHLKSRKWESFPAASEKTPGPPLGTTLGCSLELKEKLPKSSSIRMHPVLECPDVLLVRQITQHPPVTEELRRNLQDKVKTYLEQLLQRENQWEKMELKDPHTAEEKVHQNHLLQFVLSLPDAVDPPVAMEIRPLCHGCVLDRGLRCRVKKKEKLYSRHKTQNNINNNEMLWRTQRFPSWPAHCRPLALPDLRITDPLTQEQKTEKQRHIRECGNERQVGKNQLVICTTLP